MYSEKKQTPSGNDLFVTPTKKESVNMKNTTNSDYKNFSSESSHRQLNSPESFFTPLRIPGSSKTDSAEYSMLSLTN